MENTNTTPALIALLVVAIITAAATWAANNQS